MYIISLKLDWEIIMYLTSVDLEGAGRGAVECAGQGARIVPTTLDVYSYKFNICGLFCTPTTMVLSVSFFPSDACPPFPLYILANILVPYQACLAIWFATSLINPKSVVLFGSLN